MELLEQLERSTSLDRDLRSWIEASTEKLKVLRYGRSAATKLDRNFVYTVCVKHQQLRIAGNRNCTGHAGMIQL